MKLLLVDDHTLFRDALRQYLERAYDDIELDLAADFFEAEVILSQNSDYTLVLLDFMMPGMEGLSGLKILRDKYPDLRIALMSGIAEPDDVTNAMSMGAAGYFPKTLSGKALLKAIQSVIAGEIYVPLAEDNRVLPSYYTSDKPVSESLDRDGINPKSGQTQKTVSDIKFTPREKQVLQYLMRGLPNKDIANDLGLQLVTVKLHVRGVCRKLNVENRTQAALRARELGLFRDDAL